MKNKKVVISTSASQKTFIEKWLKYWKNKGYKVINYPVQIKDKDFSKIKKRQGENVACAFLLPLSPPC